MKKIIFFFCLLCSLTAGAQIRSTRSGIIASSKSAAPPSGTYQNLFLWSEVIDDAAWSKGSNVSVSSTNVRNDLEGNLTMDRLSVTFGSDNYIRQSLSVTPGDSVYIAFDVTLPSSGAVTEAKYQFFNFSNFTVAAEASYFTSISTTTIRVQFGMLVPAGCTTLLCAPFITDGTGDIDIGRLHLFKVHNYNYIETTTTPYL